MKYKRAGGADDAVLFSEISSVRDVMPLPVLMHISSLFSLLSSPSGMIFPWELLLLSLLLPSKRMLCQPFK